MGSLQQTLQRYAPLWSSVALVIHDRERAGNVFVGEALFVAALLRCVQHDFAALGLLVGVGCYSNPPIDGVNHCLET
jgi:hypothetical protein